MIAQTRDGDVEFVARAAERGISAWIESTRRRPSRARSRSRCGATRRPQRLEEKVEQLESALERRAVIERAKGILMERHGDRRARRVRACCATTPARQSRRVVDVALAVTEGHALLPKRD